MRGDRDSATKLDRSRDVARALAVCSAMVLATAFSACAKFPIAPIQNAAPTVTVVFEGSSTCTPQLGKPCTLDVLAQASDPEGDPLRYAWSGCATGTSPRATCTVDRPGLAEASVEVSDDHGHAVNSAISGEGTNHPSGVQIGYNTVFPSGSIELLGNVSDPDEGYLCGRQYCVSATASGACGSPSLECTCLAGLEAHVTRTAATGICTVTFSLKDSWGQLGTPAMTFDVSNPRVPGVSSNAMSLSPNTVHLV
jgi:hypothetical protein